MPRRKDFIQGSGGPWHLEGYSRHPGEGFCRASRRRSPGRARVSVLGGRGASVHRREGRAAAWRRHARSRRRRRPSTSSGCTGRDRARSSSARGRASGRWSAWRPAAPEAEDRPDRFAPERSRPGWRLGRPVLDRRVGPARGAHARPRLARARLVRLEPARRRAAPATGRGGCAADPDAGAVEGERADPPRRPLVRHRRSRSRSSTTPPAPTRTRVSSRRRSSAGSRPTTCRGTAGTTWATTSSSTSTARSSRAGSAGSSGTSSAPMRRGSTPARSASALLGNYGDGGGRPGGARRARQAARVAARRRPRRPARDPELGLRRQPALPARRAGLSPLGRRPSRHRLHRLPRREAVRAARLLARDVAATGLPKVYAPTVRGGIGGPDALHRQALGRRRRGR